MNIKQQNAIRGLLKKHGYKNAGNVVRPVLGINFDVFLQKTEPLLRYSPYSFLLQQRK